MSDNHLVLVGNLTSDPTLRFTQSGRAMATFTLASTRRYKSQGEEIEKTTFANCIAWGQLAENLAASALKGQRWWVMGELEQRKYTTKAGEEREVMEINVADAGPSVKWATVTVERTERSTTTAASRPPDYSGDF